MENNCQFLEEFNTRVTAVHTFRMDESALSERLRALLTSDPALRGNQTVLAKAAGVSQSALTKMLSGATTDPKYSTVKKLAQYFKVSEGYFFGESWQPPPKYGPISANILTEIIKGVEEALKEMGASLPPDKKAELVSLFYSDYVERGERPDKSKIVQIVRIAA